VFLSVNTSVSDEHAGSTFRVERHGNPEACKSWNLINAQGLQKLMQSRVSTDSFELSRSDVDFVVATKIGLYKLYKFFTLCNCELGSLISILTSYRFDLWCCALSRWGLTEPPITPDFKLMTDHPEPQA
jgi:hypothetical protein